MLANRVNDGHGHIPSTDGPKVKHHSTHVGIDLRLRSGYLAPRMARLPDESLQKTPWPWFGGKSDAAPSVWSALGDCDHYVEPFAGSLAVLLRRPHPCHRTYYSETVNDMDGLLCNAWRSIQMSPRETADAASWPVCEADLHARHVALVRWREAHSLERLMGDPSWHDPQMAGWWAWGQSSWIGGGWCSGTGPWTVDADGIFYKQGRESREPGVRRQRPHLNNDGQGVNRPQMREPGVGDYHPMTMPELLRWFEFLSARLRHVRILNGDWRRACTNGALKTLSVRQGDGAAGVFLDPPYSGDVRDDGLYAVEDYDVAKAVNAWCIDNGADPKLRIVFAGFDTEHENLEGLGWRVVEWYRAGWLKGGMANTGQTEGQQKRERLWLSPHCLVPSAAPAQQTLMGF